MDDGVGGTEEAEQELLAALAPVEENKATDAENPPLQTGPPLLYLRQAGRSRMFTFCCKLQRHVPLPSKATFGLGRGNFIKWTVQAPARPFGGKGIPIESASRAKDTGQKPP